MEEGERDGERGKGGRAACEGEDGGWGWAEVGASGGVLGRVSEAGAGWGGEVWEEGVGGCGEGGKVGNEVSGWVCAFVLLVLCKSKGQISG